DFDQDWIHYTDSPNLSSINSQTACTAFSASEPLAVTHTSEPIPAPNINRFKMESAGANSFLNLRLISDLKADAKSATFADARAWRPLRFIILTVREYSPMFLGISFQNIGG